MKRLALALLLIPFLVLPASAGQPYPFRDKEAFKEVVEGVQPTMCPGSDKPMLRMDTLDAKDGSYFGLLVGGNRWVSVLVQKDRVVYIWQGHFENDRFVVDEEFADPNAAQAKYPGGPCQWLTSESS